MLGRRLLSFAECGGHHDHHQLSGRNTGPAGTIITIFRNNNKNSNRDVVKWRKRYFVLRMPPAASSLPGSWLLEYYDGPRCAKRYGSIDLDSCEEVTIHELDTYTEHTNLFTLLSKHKGRSRNYYLAAPDRDTMNHWVECLCKVCGFKPDDHRPDEDDWPHQAAPTPMQERYGIPPHTGITVERQPVPDVVPRSMPSVLNSPEHEPPLLGSHGHNSRHSNTASTGTTVSPGRNTMLALDSVPPAPAVRSRDLRASVDSTDSVPDEQAPEPPGKTGAPRLPSESDTGDSTTYDHPRHQSSYVNLPPHQNTEGTYQVPPHPTPVMPGPRSPRNVTEGMQTKVPPATPINREQSTRDSTSSGGSHGSNKDSAYISSEDHEQMYDQLPPGVPRCYSNGKDLVEHITHGLQRASTLERTTSAANSKKGTPHHHPHHHHHHHHHHHVSSHVKAMSESNVTNLNETVPPPSHLIAQQPYMNIPPTSRSHPGYENTDTMEPDYDVPPIRKDSSVDVGTIGSMPPPPAPHMLPKMPHYVNTPGTRNYKSQIAQRPVMSSSAADDDTYLPMNVKQSEYLPMGATSGGYVPMPKGDRVETKSYLNMSGDVSTGPVYRTKALNDTVYLPMQSGQSDIDTYMPMVSGAHSSFDDNYVAMAPGRASCNSVYTDMSQPPPQQAPSNPAAHSIYEVPPSNKPVPFVPPRTTTTTTTTTSLEPPRLQRHPSSNASDGALIFGSHHRTRSFKREVPRPPPIDPPLPKKPSVSTGDSSSSEDDDGSGSSLDRSSDTLPSHKLPKVDMLSKKSLNSTPPPPKRPGEVQYLDLALESKGSDTERSPVFPRSPPPPASRHHSNPSPTEYKEIDFVKTKALTEVKKTVESKRKSSEKSVDE